MATALSPLIAAVKNLERRALVRMTLMVDMQGTVTHLPVSEAFKAEWRQVVQVVAAEYERRETPAPPEPETAPVVQTLRMQVAHRQGVRVRALPSLREEQVGLLPYGTQHVFFDGADTADGYQWYQLADGSGWAAASHLVYGWVLLREA